jgi:hypothetical protein
VGNGYEIGGIMKDKCLNCKEWHTIYLLAKSEFEKKLGYAMTITIVCIILMFIATIITALCVTQTQRFINQFQYVEETEYQIHQDEGINTAIIDSDKSEVEIYGESNKDDKGYCESDSQKNN